MNAINESNLYGSNNMFNNYVNDIHIDNKDNDVSIILQHISNTVQNDRRIICCEPFVIYTKIETDTKNTIHCLTELYKIYYMARFSSNITCTDNIAVCKNDDSITIDIDLLQNKEINIQKLQTSMQNKQSICHTIYDHEEQNVRLCTKIINAINKPSIDALKLIASTLFFNEETCHEYWDDFYEEVLSHYLINNDLVNICIVNSDYINRNNQNLKNYLDLIIKICDTDITIG